MFCLDFATCFNSIFSIVFFLMEAKKNENFYHDCEHLLNSVINITNMSNCLLKLFLVRIDSSIKQLMNIRLLIFMVITYSGNP